MPSWLRESTAAFLPLSVQKVIDTYIVGDETSTFYLTFWSVMHFLAGSFVAWMAPKLTLLEGFALHSGFELWEWVLDVTPSNARGLLDTCLDTVFFLSGFALVRSAQTKKLMSADSRADGTGCSQLPSLVRSSRDSQRSRTS